MGIAKAQFNGILTSIFQPGNIIRLYKNVPDKDEKNGMTLTGSGVVDYEIKSGDFTVDRGVVTSAKTMMFYLYEGEATTCQGFGVFSANGSELLYFGEFKDHLPLEYNDVPAIKAYNAEKGEGIQISMTSEDASATTT